MRQVTSRNLPRCWFGQQRLTGSGMKPCREPVRTMLMDVANRMIMCNDSFELYESLIDVPQMDPVSTISSK